MAVLGQLVEDEPVSYLALGEHVLQALPEVLVVLVTDLETENTDRLSAMETTHRFEEQLETKLLKEEGADPGY